MSKSMFNRGYTISPSSRKLRAAPPPAELKGKRLFIKSHEPTASRGTTTPAEYEELATTEAASKGTASTYLMHESLPETLDQQFSELVVAWKMGRGTTSDTMEMILHPAYQRIIGMGQKVLPLLFRELQREPDHWFWALRSITGTEPVWPEENTFIAAVDAWLAWGKEHGYL